MSFGGSVIKSGGPVKQEKQLKHASLVANAVVLSNVADLTTVIGPGPLNPQPLPFEQPL